MTVPEIADALERRQGAKKDDDQESPFSDSAFNRMGRDLRLAGADRPEAEMFARHES